MIKKFFIGQGSKAGHVLNIYSGGNPVDYLQHNFLCEIHVKIVTQSSAASYWQTQNQHTAVRIPQLGCNFGMVTEELNYPPNYLAKGNFLQ